MQASITERSDTGACTLYLSSMSLKNVTCLGGRMKRWPNSCFLWMTTKRREIVEVYRHDADVASFFRLHRMLDQFVILSKSV